MTQKTVCLEILIQFSLGKHKPLIEVIGKSVLVNSTQTCLELESQLCQTRIKSASVLVSVSDLVSVF